MAARKSRAVRPVDAALARLMLLVGKGVAPGRMAREVDTIAGEWRSAPEADESDVRERLEELREQIAAGVGHAEEQLSDVDASEAAAVKQAGTMLAALVATRDAAVRAMTGAK